jgi:hypothetical protein
MRRKASKGAILLAWLLLIGLMMLSSLTSSSFQPLLARHGTLGFPPGFSYAADDSNSGSFVQSQALNPVQLNSTLATLSQGMNNTQAQQLISRLQSELGSGNLSAEANTLSELKGLLNSTAGGAGGSSNGIPNSLQYLIKSLNAGNNGLTLDSNLLASLLGNAGPNGLPAGLGNMTTSSVTQLSSLASLLQGVNPALAQQLLDDVSSIQQGLGSGNGGNNNNSVPPFPSGIPKGPPGFNAPKVSPPALGTTNVLKLPSINLFTIITPIMLVAAGLALYFSRRRVAGILGSQMLFGPKLRDDSLSPLQYDPTDPRKRIAYYFAKTVRAMRGRGISKAMSETHREFNEKCATSEESHHVNRISELYEKAEFSGRSVSNAEADEAGSNLVAIENKREGGVAEEKKKNERK